MRRHHGLCLGSLTALFALAAGVALAVAAGDEKEKGFVRIFDGKSLSGWQLIGKVGDGYEVDGGVLFSPAGGGGKLLTEKEYSNFIFRFEYRLPPGGNNGVGIRAPKEGDAAYVGMEIQILDDDDARYANLQPFQYHGSIYGVVAAKRGAPKKAGEWNSEEILCDGRHVKVTVNDKVVVDANLDDVEDEDTLSKHPGLKRTKGYIGFLGHGDRVEFRNIRIKELPDGGK